MDTMPETREIFLPKEISDHFLAKVKVRGTKTKITRQFQYSNVWRLHPTVLDDMKIR